MRLQRQEKGGRQDRRTFKKDCRYSSYARILQPRRRRIRRQKVARDTQRYARAAQEKSVEKTWKNRRNYAKKFFGFEETRKGKLRQYRPSCRHFRNAYARYDEAFDKDR